MGGGGVGERDRVLVDIFIFNTFSIEISLSKEC